MRSWARPTEVEPGSGIAQQLTLMEELVREDITGPDFARAWYSARNSSLRAGERIREPFYRILNEVFYALEDYAIDPTLYEEGDTTDEELVACVRDALAKLRALERQHSE